MTNELVVVIILNLNKAKDLLACVVNAYSQNHTNKKIIVVDNGSTDDSMSLVKAEFPDILLIESDKNLGVAGGRNLGIKTAIEKFDFTYIVFLDNDVVIDKNFLAQMITPFSSNEKIGITAPKCLSFQNPKVIEYAGGIHVNFFTGNIKNIGNGKADDGNFDKPRFLPSCGGLFMTTKTILNEAGLFDEKFNPYAWEDVDFSIRVRKKGYKIFYNPKAIVYHKGGKRLRTKSTSEYEYSKIKNYFYLLRKHATAFQFFTLIFCLPFTLFTAILEDLSHKNYKSLIYKLKGLLEIIGLRKKQMQENR